MGKCLFLRKGETHTAPISGILASDLAVGSIVKLNENGTAVDYIVVHQGIPSDSYDESCNGTWLLRKDIYSTRVWDNVRNDYENSGIHPYLNSGFIALFDNNVQSLIKQVKIPYTQGDGYSGSVVIRENGLSTKIFLLSTKELGWDYIQYTKNFGELLSYFGNCEETDAKRIAYTESGSATAWWTRTPAGNSNGGAYTVTVIGGYKQINTNRSTTSGIRPALILPSNALFDKNTLILKGVA